MIACNSAYSGPISCRSKGHDLQAGNNRKGKGKNRPGKGGSPSLPSAERGNGHGRVWGKDRKIP